MSYESVQSEYWGCLEAMGRTVRYGRIEEVMRGGHLLFRVHVADTTSNHVITEEYGAGSIFRLTRGEQSHIREQAEQCNRYELQNSRVSMALLKSQVEESESALFEDDGMPF